MKERYLRLRPWILIFPIALLALLMFMLAYLPNQPIADELIHLPQIQSFMSGSLTLNGIVAMPPGFHYSISSIAGILKLQNLTELRAINATIALICPILFWIYLRLDGAQYPTIRSTQFLLMPIIWPFFFLLYTDISSVLFLLTNLILIKRGYLISTAVICTISLSFRQNNIFWIALLWAISIHAISHPLLSTNKSSQITLETFKKLKQSLKKTIVFLLPFSAFALFIYLNGGVAMGNKDLHQASGLYPTQIFFCLLVLWIVLLPLHIHNLSAIFSLIVRHKSIVIGLALLAILYKFSFDISHPYNFPSDYFIRNWILHRLKDRSTWFLLAFLPMAWALLSIAITPLKNPAYYWLYPITLLSLLPVHLIEQRYYIIPLTLFLLFRAPIARSWELALIAWVMLLSILVTSGIASMKIFL